MQIETLTVFHPENVEPGIIIHGYGGGGVAQDKDAFGHIYKFELQWVVTFYKS